MADTQTRANGQRKRSTLSRTGRWLSRILLWSLLPLAGAFAQAPARNAQTPAESAPRGLLPSDELAQWLAQKPPAADPGTLEARRRRLARIGWLALIIQNDPIYHQALEQLARLAEGEDCTACATQQRLLEASHAMNHGQQDAALARLNTIEPTLDADSPPDLAQQLHAIRAEGLRSIGDFAGSIAQAVAAYQLAEREGDAEQMVDLTTLLAIDNAELGDFQRADVQIRDAIALAERHHDSYRLALAWLNLGHLRARENRRDAQRDALLTTLQMTRGKRDFAGTEVIALSNLSDYYLYRKDWPQALEYAHRAEALARQLGKQRALSVATINAGIALAGMGQADAGIARVQEAIAIAKRINNREYIVGMTHELIRIYEETGRWREAVELFHQVEDDEKALTEQQRQFATLALQEQFSAERKTREIERLTAENARQRAEVDARNAQRWLWISAAITLALATILLAQWLRHLRRANRQLSEESALDPLTGAFNRRRLEWMLGEHASAWRHAADAVPPIALVMLDLDHFKRVNDGFGHDAGDAVLVALVERMRALLRQHDAVVRWGGEEFVLALPGAGIAGIRALMPRILHVIAATPVTSNGHRIAITLSAGAMAFPLRPGQAWQEAIHLADQALYLAKAGGRNRGVIVSAMDLATDPMQADFDIAAARAAGAITLETITGPEPAPGS